MNSAVKEHIKIDELTTGIRLILITIFLGLTSATAMAQDGEESFSRQLDSLLTLANTLDDEDSLLTVLHTISMTHNNVDSVEKYSKLELELAQKAGAPQMAASAYMALGWCYYNRYDYKEANTYYYKAINICDSIGDKKSLAICYHDLANSMAMMSHYNESDDYDQLALKLFVELNDSAYISYIYRSLGQTCIDFHRFKMAKEHLLKALEIDIKQDNKVGMADDYMHIGTAELCEFRDKQTDSLIIMAKAHTMLAYSLLKSQNNELVLMIVCQNLMDIYFKYALTKQYPERQIYIDSSKQFFEQGFALAQKNGYLDDSHDFKMMKAQYCIEEKDYDHAYRILKRADSEFQDDSAYIDFRIELYDVFAEYYSSIGQYKKAFEYQSKAKKLRKENFNIGYALQAGQSNVQEEFDRLRQDQEIKSEQLKIMSEDQKFRQTITNISSAAALVILIVFITVSYYRMKGKRRLGGMLERHNRYIKKQRDELSATNNQIKSSISYAQRIQYSMMPDKSEITNLFGDTLVMWQPLNTVSGDFFWATKIGNKKLIAVVDCTGHGVPGALMSMLGMSTLSDIVNSLRFHNIEPVASEILDQMRSRVIESLHQTERNTMALDGMDMALCIFDEEKMTMQFAGAFRPLVIVRNGKLTLYKGDKMPVSLLSLDDKPFRNNVIEMQHGDTVYLFSDGIQDQLGYNGNGKVGKFSTRRFLNILERTSKKSFDEQYRIIEDALEEWRSSQVEKPFTQTDDIILIGFRI